jgi:drug/metabolite transporter (DMT)-like permease
MIKQYLPLVLYSLGMVLGQVLLKQASLSLVGATTIADKCWAMATTPMFYIAIGWYGLMTAAWVWILTLHPLSRAYPWVALSLVLTPIVAAVVYDESFTPRLGLGLVFIFVGVLLTAESAGKT